MNSDRYRTSGPNFAPETPICAQAFRGPVGPPYGRSVDHTQLWHLPSLWNVTRTTVSHNQMILFVLGVSQRAGRLFVLDPSWYGYPVRRSSLATTPSLTMDTTKSQRPKRRDTTLSSLNAAIEATNLAKDALSMTPAKAAVGSISVILTLTRVGSLLPSVGRVLADVYRTR